MDSLSTEIVAELQRAADRTLRGRLNQHRTIPQLFAQRELAGKVERKRPVLDRLMAIKRVLYSGWRSLLQIGQAKRFLQCELRDVPSFISECPEVLHILNYERHCRSLEVRLLKAQDAKEKVDLR